MENTEIKQTLNYLKELKEQLYEFELFTDVEMTLMMHELYKLIEKLMNNITKRKPNGIWGCTQSCH